jgi:hypothetical protein
VPTAGPQWQRGLSQPRAAALGYDKPLCASLDGFTLHAATRAGALHLAGREALLRYVLRPPLAQQRLEHGAGDLVRVTLKRPYADGTVAVEMDPLSLLCRLATSVPPPRFHTVNYAGVLAPASPWRSRIAPQPEPPLRAAETEDAAFLCKHAGSYRAWAELLKRAFDIDVLDCPNCHGRMKLLAMLRPEQRRLHERALLRHYHRALCAHDVRGYPLRMLRFRYRAELIAIVVVTVLILDGAHMTEDAVAKFAGRVDVALADAHASRLLAFLGVVLRVTRWFRRWFRPGALHTPKP